MSLNDDAKKVEQVESTLKNTIVGATTTFGGAFKATLGFYAAQTVATLLGLATFAIIGLVIYGIWKLL